MFAATPLLKMSAFWRSQQLQMMRVPAVQQAELLRMVRRSEITDFGRDHQFASIKSVEDYQARVPLRVYADFWKEYWKESFPVLRNCTWPGLIPYFALTSGTTTGNTKYIPCSQDMVRSNTMGAYEVLLMHYMNRPSTAVAGGKFLVLGGSTDLHEEAPGVYSGDLSGIEAVENPWWAAPYTLPPREIALLADWEEKINRLAEMALKEDVRSITGTPRWMLVFFEKMAELHPSKELRLVNFFPNLEVIIFGGMDFKPYARRFAEIMQGSRAELREAYAASEGFLAVADRGQDEGMRLIVDNGVFFEFVPVSELKSPNPTRHWLGNVETGVDYAVVLSTCAGLWSYMIGDTVRFVDTNPPRILITGRTSYVLSAFGEHLIDIEIEEAISQAADKIGATINDYSVAAKFPEKQGARGRHRYVIEFDNPQPGKRQITTFGKTLDSRLCQLNADYSGQRNSGAISLQEPEIVTVKPGTFMAWMKKRGQLGGQHKVPRIVSDGKLAAHLWDFCGLDREEAASE